ncbi:MAG: hypothetical protein KDK89_16700 [Alphaproteobacteria bacterium]|nr:hypothetical protein [Alphaproteobacteria bacterium]
MKRRSLLIAPLALTIGSALANPVVVRSGNARLTIDIAPPGTPGFSSLVQGWVEKSAAAIRRYYGRFPVPEVHIQVLIGGGPGVHGGQSIPGDVPLIRVRAGSGSRPKDLLEKDWVMVHEMVHLAFPWMDLKHNWMAEGLAVYVESIARLQAGHLTREAVWGDFVKMMPRGLPAAGEGGFEVTRTWGRTYWGGALFCLLADLSIRRETSNRAGLQQALRAINAERDFRRAWDFQETLAVGDAATGTRVLTSQFEAMRDDPVSPDLAALWRDLGVVVKDGAVTFDGDAPSATVRQAIETAPA